MLQIYVRKKKVIFLFIFIFFIALNENFAQDIQTPKVTEKKPHSAHKASIYSFILPGLGQAYNKKYWKIPILYAGFGFLTYMIITNRKEYKAYQLAYDYKKDEAKYNPPPNFYYPPNDYAAQYGLEALKQGRNYYRRNMELSYILTGVWYLLNVIDASVDAHLFDFNISPDLSLKVEPYFNHQPYNNQTITGLRLKVAIPGVFGFK